MSITALALVVSAGALLILLPSCCCAAPPASQSSAPTPSNEILARYPGQDDYVSPWSTVAAVSGGAADLPCDLRPPKPDDPPVLVLWYRTGVQKPIYSYDVRSGVPSHWKNTQALGSRASYHADRSILSLQRVSPKDAATYTCRIDFKISPTLTYIVNLTVTVPPRRLFITNAAGKEVDSLTGPLQEKDALQLTCTAEGGSPPPHVSWWDGERLLDSTMSSNRDQTVTTTLMVEPRRVSNTVLLEPVTRADLHRSLTCRSSNTNLSAPLSSTISIDLSLPPLWIKILTARRPLSADRAFEVTCQTAGSRPPARLTWHLDGKPLSTYTSKASDGTNVTTSVLQFTPKVGDGGRVLTCAAELSQQLLETVTRNRKSGALEDSWKLVVHYIPRATLRPGRSLDLSNIEEGDDVYFECSVDSSPPVYKIIWLHQGRPLQHNVSAGVILSNQSLVVQGVDRSASGEYTCTASNIEGDGVSNTVTLSVKYAPVCQNDQPMYHGAARHEQVSIPCYLEAHPLPHTFSWTFNNSGESVKIPQEHVTVSGAHSTVSYTPKTELDYGTLLCWGSNAVGKQKRPCVFHVFPAGRPDPVSNCSQFNLSATSVSIHCTAGFDGGLPQTFIMELYDGTTGHLVANVTHTLPNLSATALDPGSTFAGVIYSVNAKGKGELLSISAVTIQDQAEKRTAAIKPAPEPGTESHNFVLKGSFLAIVAGATTGFVLMLAIIAVVVRVHLVSRSRCRGQENAMRRGDPRFQGSVIGGTSCSSKSGAGSGAGSITTSTGGDTCSTVTTVTHLLREPPPSPLQGDELNPDILSHTEDWRSTCGVHTISSSSLASSMATLPRGTSLYHHHQHYPVPQSAGQYQSCAGDLLPSGLTLNCPRRQVAQTSYVPHTSSRVCLSTAIPYHHRSSTDLGDGFTSSSSSAYTTLDHRLLRQTLPPPPPEFSTQPPPDSVTCTSTGPCEVTSSLTGVLRAAERAPHVRIRSPETFSAGLGSGVRSLMSSGDTDLSGKWGGPVEEHPTTATSPKYPVSMSGSRKTTFPFGGRDKASEGTQPLILDQHESSV